MERDSLLGRPSSSGQTQAAPGASGGGAQDRRVTYVFTGKLTLFPVLILLSVFVAGLFLAVGHQRYREEHGGRKHTSFYYILSGTLFSMITLALLGALWRLVVIKVVFSFSPTTMRITKSGVVRSSTFEFRASRTSLHFLRTHFLDERAWLRLVVQEDGKYYQLVSWRGKGQQKQRFLELFDRLQRELHESQRVSKSPRPGGVLASEILSKEELTLINPFTGRLQRYFSKTAGRPGEEEDRAAAGVLCAEDMQIIDLDLFYHHFRYEKRKRPQDSDQDPAPLSLDGKLIAM